MWKILDANWSVWEPKYKSDQLSGRDIYSWSLDHLCGALFIHIQEVEETAVFFVPAILKGKLQVLVNGCPLECLVALLCTELEKKPTRFQGVA